MSEKFGPTGTYPRGSLGPHDEGGLRIGVAHDSKGNIIINFGVEVSWIGMPPENAIDFARSILKHAGVSKVTIEFGSFKATTTTEDKRDG
jgi:hypothetical protein